jgi:lysophospholipase L1-like esterase
LKAGDYVLIQFGHNDASPVNDNRRARGVLDGIGDDSVEIFNQLTQKEENVYSYGQYLRSYISDIRKAGAVPIICSPVPTNGPIIEKLSKYTVWAKQVAKTEGVAFLDLNTIISEAYSTLEKQSINRFFVDDKVHYTKEGANFTSKLVVSALKRLNDSQITEWLNDDAAQINAWKGKMETTGYPVVSGYGEDLFRVDSLIYANNFIDGSDWLIQVEKTESPYEARIDFFNGSLEMLTPGRGATIWNKNKFTGNLTIIYKVKAPSTYIEKLGVIVRDINTFWHASHPGSADQIFNADLYTGAFPSYHTLSGYYASIGGRDNTTTRFRRYPRIVNGEEVSHIALTDKDGLKDHLIKPDQLHTIQVVIFEDVIQYLVDGKVFYEIKEGDNVQIINAKGETEEVTYKTTEFEAYDNGWFAFRMVNTHHIFSDFRVYRLVSASK